MEFWLILQAFDIDVKYVGDDMTLSVFDEDVTSSDLVGTATVKLSALCVNGGLDEWYQVQFKGKNCGSVHLRSHWTPDAIGIKVAVAQPMPMQMPQATVTIQQQPPMGYMQAPQMGMGYQPAAMGPSAISYGVQPMGYQQP